MSHLRHQLTTQLPHPIGFVLGGGGSLGAMQVGMLQALAEHAVVADLVAGTSIGAINGAVIAGDPTGAANRLSHIWHSLDDDQILGRGLTRRLYTILRHRSHVYDSAGLARLGDEILGEVSIEDLAIPYAAVALDVATAQAVTFRDGPVKSAALASSAIPGIFPPVTRGSRSYYDGGLVNNVPVSAAVEMGAKSLVVLDCAFADQPLQAPATVTDAFFYASTVAMRQQLVRELPAVAEHLPVLYLPGATPQRMTPLDFTHTPELIASAYTNSRAFLDTVTVDGPGLYRSATDQARPEEESISAPWLG